jgi:hypothetical protein
MVISVRDSKDRNIADGGREASQTAEGRQRLRGQSGTLCVTHHGGRKHVRAAEWDSKGLQQRHRQAGSPGKTAGQPAL